ncbi:DEAD/DEAH box helicase [Akkermansiaceae bacterium]|jgi:superfamily II DNA/RNA helicase|nr:DEAD/DEAH box helicase [Akkermansiaceae bacterium]
MSFSALGLSAPLVQAVAQFDKPTPVQLAAIPEALTGGDLLVTAKTGSGKTTAFVLPILECWFESTRVNPKQVYSLILVPTRELAAQVREVVQEYAKHLPERIKVVSAVGGVSINPQMMALRGGADVIVATPGRLLDLVEKNAVKLDHVSTLVLDEADRMLDLGFAAELNRILVMLPSERQNWMFSATFPKAVEAIAGEILREPRRIEIESEPEEDPDILQRAIRVDTAKRTPLLRHLIAEEGWGRVLVFVGKRYTADLVADKLDRFGFKALSLHGDLSQGSRSEALRHFKSESIQVLVTTDLAARGLDIVSLPVVLNYELPRSPADYIHRIGRTGRAGENGEAISFVTAESAAHFNLIEKRNGLSLPREVIAGFEPTDSAPALSTGTGGIKGKRKSKKDKLREAAAREARNEGRPES